MCGKNFQIYGVIKKNARKILENALIRGIFTHAPPHSKLAPQILVIMPWAEGNYSFPQAAFFRKPVSPNSRKEWRKL